MHAEFNQLKKMLWLVIDKCDAVIGCCDKCKAVIGWYDRCDAVIGCSDKTESFYCTHSIFGPARSILDNYCQIQKQFYLHQHSAVFYKLWIKQTKQSMSNRFLTVCAQVCSFVQTCSPILNKIVLLAYNNQKMPIWYIHYIWVKISRFLLSPFRRSPTWIL